jgi:hypothetical protein
MTSDAARPLQPTARGEGEGVSSSDDPENDLVNPCGWLPLQSSPSPPWKETFGEVDEELVEAMMDFESVCSPCRFGLDWCEMIVISTKPPFVLVVSASEKLSTLSLSFGMVSSLDTSLPMSLTTAGGGWEAVICPCRL